MEKSKEYKGAGDDFASVTEHSAGEPPEGKPVSISPRMLGGGQRLWYQDGSIYGKHLDWDPPREPRYKDSGEGKLMPYDTAINENKAFKSVPSEDSKKLAEKLARVVIENNTATGVGISGGGIANNGQLFFGTSDGNSRSRRHGKAMTHSSVPRRLTLIFWLAVSRLTR
ncbi:MAG: LPXTG-motif cell wall anchor protein [Varibaculum cambriense DORA_20]|uniref:hypothetical protein n=1 Tax=Varibaculum cambriense TaxID=184870 RepID=UPI0003D5EED0|nr:hypothetical protein [Varibaculum cambriense]ETI83544.1 MAG: LPXTG-motif cell wall anchor protein [Varibaculum cambriense DORA_20]